MIRVIIADDHNLVRQGIRALLERTDDIVVVGEAADGQEAIGLVESLTPDVLVTDIAMPRLGGVQVAERVHALVVLTRVVILSMYSDIALVRQALRLGACGYLLKRSVTEELLLAIRAAYRGETYLSPAISGPILAEFLAGSADSAESDAFDSLTPREREVLQLVAEGHTNTAIAQMMHISPRTVEKHRANLATKLGVRDVAGLTRIAIERRLIFPDGQVPS